ncbi:hypothetical protein [Hydromonas duriensis]|uniref:Hyaluronidase n=1 Tax=Hydromonas duriensis TaxID=1527608 RepID=A0A4R6Y775_9BURK|nr:hypothetical protein [Hydromonas duriensis]TDR31164.1 hyaluronidase [Hydromonas duriensis]
MKPFATRLFLMLFGLAMLMPFESQAELKRSFTVYAFLPWGSGTVGYMTELTSLEKDLKKMGIQPIWVVYEPHFSSPWGGQPTSQVKVVNESKQTLVIDEEKIKTVALNALRHPDIPVSFDTEFGSRFKPETVKSGVLEIIRLFKKYNNKSKVGVYAVAPQVIYAWQEDAAAKMQILNREYRDVANAVDFFSPMIYYRYNIDLPSWEKAAEYSINAAKSYRMDKPIIPYVSFDYNDHSEVSEQDAKKRMTFLYEHGAAGCIVWGSSKDKSFFDRRSGWSKAMVDFAAAHR